MSVGTRGSARALCIAAMALAPAFGCEAPHRPTACAAAPEYKPTTYYGDLTAQISLASVKLPGVRLQLQDSPGGKLLSILQGGETESECVLVVDGETIADAGVCQEVTARSGKTLTVVTGGTCGGCRDLAPQVSVTVEGKVEGLDVADPTKAIPTRWTFTGTKLPPEQKTLPDFLGAPQLKMHFGARASDSGFLDAPFPEVSRFRTRPEDGKTVVDLTGFPKPAMSLGLHWLNPMNVATFAVLGSVIDVLEHMAEEHGFSLSSGIFFQSTGALRALDHPETVYGRPDAGAYRGLDDPFVIAPVVPAAGGGWKLDALQPLRAHVRTAAGSLALPNMVTLLPLPGRPLREDTLYVAFVRTAGLEGVHKAIEPTPEMQQVIAMAGGAHPPNVPKEYGYAAQALKAAGVDLGSIAALTVFQTGHPTAELRGFFQANAAAKTTMKTAFKLGFQNDEMCAYQGTADVPVFQDGDPPYEVGHGVFVQRLLDDLMHGLGKPKLSEGGNLVLTGGPVKHAESRVVVTVPKRPREKRPAKWPAVVYVRAGAGGSSADAPLTDRGPTLPDGVLVPGCLPRWDGTAAPSSNQTCEAGPGREYARAGLVGITVDGPQTGSRLRAGSSVLASIAPPCGVDGNTGEDNAMFDVCNPSAIADNIRESAIEAALVPRMLLSDRFIVEGPLDGSGDPCGLAGIQFDDKRLALMGHSMGATIVPLVLALEPRFRAVVMSGANASYIENFPSKQRPFELASLLEQMLGLDYCLDEFELLPSLFEWAEEASDPAVYERYAGQGKMPDVLMIQGIGDHYVPSPVANASSLGLGLDVAGKTYDDEDPHLCPGETKVPIMECRGARRYQLSPVAPLLSSLLKRKQYETIPPGGLDAKRAGSGAATFVSQYPRDRVCRQDGHEVAYQIAKARWQYRCFLESFAAGHTRVFAPPPGDPNDDSWEIDAPCPKGGP